MKRLAFAIAFPLITATAFAEGSGGEIPDSAVKQLAEDLDQLQAKVLDAQKQAELERQASAAGGKVVVVTAPSAKIMSGASKATKVLMSAKAGEAYPVVDKSGQWYAIALTKNPDSLGAVGGYKELAGWVSASDVAPKFFKLDYTTWQEYVGHQLGASAKKASGSFFQTVTEEATAFRTKYQNNPYFKVAGFAVNTTPPGLTLNFEFK